MSIAPQGVCPYCSSPLVELSGGKCPHCRTFHHSECWESNGGCTTFGCAAGPRNGLPPTALIERYAPMPIAEPAHRNGFRAFYWVLAAVIGTGLFLVLRPALFNFQSPVMPVTPVVATPLPTSSAVVPIAPALTIKIEQPSLPSPAGVVDNPSAKRGQVLSPQLNVRTGPGTNYPVVTRLNQNEWVDLLEFTSGWWLVVYHKGEQGYVSGNYIRVDEEASEPKTDDPQQRTFVPTVSSTALVFYRAFTQSDCGTYNKTVLLNGMVSKDGKGVNGLQVAIRFQADTGNKAVTYRVKTAPYGRMQTWLQGYFAFVIAEDKSLPIPKVVEIWVMDRESNRISDVVTWYTPGKDSECNKLTINFVFP